MNVEPKKIKLGIKSRIENVSLVGLSINNLCSIIPLSKVDAFQIELCIVEAVTNSIKHAYESAANQDVEVVFSFDENELTLDVRDTGKPLDKKVLDEKGTSSLEVSPDNIDGISESGRGIALIKEIMDKVEYTTENGVNHFTMLKNIVSNNQDDPIK